MFGRRCVLNGPGSAVAFTPVDLGTWDIVPYTRLPGDNAYLIPDGSYYVGSSISNAAHPATAGRFGGYAVIGSHTPYGVAVDMGYPGKALGNGATANGDMVLNGVDAGGTTGGIVFDRIKFQNGHIQNKARNVHFWYPEMTFPASVWAAEPGRSTNTSYHNDNTCLFIELGCVHSRIYGANIHDVGSGPTWHNGSRFVYLTGFTVRDVSDGGPSVDVVDNVHPDSLAFLGGNIWHHFVTDFDIQPNFSGGQPGNGIQLQNFSGATSSNVFDNQDVNFARGWIHGASGFGFDVDSEYSTNPHLISGSLADIHVWNNGSVQGGQNLASWQFIQTIDYPNQASYSITSFPQPSRIDFTTSGVCDTLVAQVGTDPATAWQSTPGQRPTDVLTFFASLGWPMS